jgi:hypothetical protein
MFRIGEKGTFSAVLRTLSVRVRTNPRMIEKQWHQGCAALNSNAFETFHAIVLQSKKMAVCLVFKSTHSLWVRGPVHASFVH